METTTDGQREREILTHPLELFLEVGEVLALGDPEVVVRVVRLVHAVGGRRRADGQHGGRPRRALRLPHLLHGHGRAGHLIRPLSLSTLYQRQEASGGSRSTGRLGSTAAAALARSRRSPARQVVACLLACRRRMGGRTSGERALASCGS